VCEREREADREREKDREGGRKTEIQKEAFKWD
jgi:hypothetical protein